MTRIRFHMDRSENLTSNKTLVFKDDCRYSRENLLMHNYMFICEIDLLISIHVQHILIVYHYDA